MLLFPEVQPNRPAYCWTWVRKQSRRKRKEGRREYTAGQNTGEIREAPWFHLEVQPDKLAFSRFRMHGGLPLNHAYKRHGRRRFPQEGQPNKPAS